MKLSLYVGDSRDAVRCVDAIIDAEHRGLHGAWLPQTFGIDPLIALALAAARTERIALGAGIVYVWPRHPVVLAQEALTIDAIARGRLQLGIGIGHRPVVEGALGLEWRDPVGRTRELTVLLGQLLRERTAAFRGEHYRVEASLRTTADAAAPPVVVAALGERMCHMAGAVADGVMTWLAPPAYLAGTVVPAVEAGARDAGRAAPRVIAAVPAACCDDPDAARRGMAEAFGFMARAPSYRRMLLRAGVLAPEADGFDNAAVDAVALHGDEGDLRRGAQELFSAGADEVVIWPYPAGNDPGASLARTLETLERIAAQAG